MNRTYAADWEKPEWMYDQFIQIEKLMESPEMIACKERSKAVYYEKMAAKFPEFFQHYTKIFYRAIDGKLNKKLFLMLLKQRKKMDTGEIGWEEGNNEVIGASFNLMTRGLDKETREKVTKTYQELIEEDMANKQKAVKEYLMEQTGVLVQAGEVSKEEQEQQKEDAEQYAGTKVELLEDEEEEKEKK